MNLRDLRYLLAVAEHRHFGRAAEACHVSQPTLSAQLRKLEEELGVAFFERGARSVTLTAAGRALLPHAEAAVAAADALAGGAQAMADPLAGTLRLGIIPTLAPFLLPPFMPQLRAELPRLALEPWEDLTEALLDRLRHHAVDAAVIATAPPPGELEAVPLAMEPFLAALPPGHVLVGKGPVPEASLGAELLVLADGHCLSDQAIAACGRQGAAQGTGQGFRAVSLATLMNLVAAGFGATLLPALAAGAARQQGLVLRPLAGGTARELRLVFRAATPRRPALLALAGVLRAVLFQAGLRPAGEG
ncbi:LysR substrate-binding domain-containing protein [Siccirubricoccus sp. KC 17139]|uniref:LysR substrate-binding domain-containing protein n=1 Tax=Siccirubricoccus soli TaxID=2899147 RepID=A0ABT1CZ15_9PROT|nr:LysR substrate-binding domain-containing protein [Siccirubricoccus soli]MCO6414892.1 LysR substrate-binding domain-containing protein [Siccirubricoccus soli]MCP2681022.1 LysR substrate-binding domain-containing protein [Siccirubricoccus soli]